MPRTSRFMKQFHVFLGTNSRLFLFLTLLLAGVVAGCLYAPHLPAQYRPLLTLLEQNNGGFSGFSGALFAFLRHSLVTLCAVGLLMLSGMSLCGVPVTLAVPPLYGGIWGLFLATTLESRGTVALALAVPEALLGVWTVLIACAESLRLSLRLTALVMPGSQKSGLWRDFRLFFLRFLLCFSLALLSSAVGTTLAVLV